MKGDQRGKWIGILTAFWLVGLLGGCADEGPTVAQATRTTASSEGLRIRYDVAGQGEPAIVFVHCWSCNRTFWDAQFDDLARDYRVVRLDLVGHGESDRGRETHSMAAFGSDVAHVVRELDLKHVVLVGHSMGGPVAVEAAKQLGDTVVGVVAVDVFHTAFEYPRSDAEIDAFVAPFERNFVEATTAMVNQMFPPDTDPVLIQRVVTAMQQADQRTGVQAMRAIFRWSRDQGAQSITALGDRLQNINGDPTGQGEVRSRTVRLIPGTGHFPHMQKPREFNKELRKVVAEFAQYVN